MGFGKDVIGQAAVDAAKVVDKQRAAVGHFGVLVTGPAPMPVESAKPVEPKVEPRPQELESYNFERAVEVAKKNVHDLPRLLQVELARPDGPRKTVLRAYQSLAMKGDLEDEVGLALAEKCEKALEALEG